MAIQLATTLYPDNGTVTDNTGAGVDVRLLNSTNPATNTANTAAATHTNDNVERTFQPDLLGVTNTNDANTTLLKNGWALRLSNDMTPTDDTNFDAFLPAQTVTVQMNVNATQSGGTYASGTFAPTFKASLWRYNPATNTATLIAVGITAGITWNVAPVGGDLGIAKTASITISVPATVFEASKGTAAEVLYLQLGFNTGTVPNPTLGTATFTVTLTTGNANSNVALGIGLTQLGYMVGSGAGVGAASGSGAPVLPTSGSASGVGAASGSLLAYKLVTGSSSGVGAASGVLVAFKLGTGSSAGVGAASGDIAIVEPTVGSVVIGAGSATIIKRPVYLFDD